MPVLICSTECANASAHERQIIPRWFKNTVAVTEELLKRRAEKKKERCFCTIKRAQVHMKREK